MAGREAELKEFQAVLAKAAAIAADLLETLRKSRVPPGLEVAYAFAFGLIKLAESHAVPGDYAKLAKDILNNALDVLVVEEAGKAQPS